VREKDWTDRILGASNHVEFEREENDYYATDPKAIDDLFRVEQFSDLIWECACGQGHLSERIKKYGKKVISTDLIDRNYGKGGIDFLKQEGIVFNGDIITNPPYKYCSEFILKALELIQLSHKVAMFLKIQTLEGANRYRDIYSKYPPKTIYVFSRRIKCFMNGIDDRKSSAIAYGWYVWEKDLLENLL